MSELSQKCSAVYADEALLQALRNSVAAAVLRTSGCLLQVLSNSVASFSAIGMLIVIFLVVYAIIGLQVYGQAELDVGFPNFHSFFNSLVIVFQVCSAPLSYSAK